jgi:hypothetical protein
LEARTALNEPPPETAAPASAFARLFKDEGELPKLSRGQVESYLAKNRRSAGSLLAAFRLTGDRALLQEAAEKHPDDPRVNFAGWTTVRMNQDASPTERRQWLDGFKQAALDNVLRQLEALMQAAPDNALPNYLSALNYFKAGQTDQAVQQLAAAAAKPDFQDYELDSAQSAQEAYLAAGYSMAQAKAAANFGLPIPQFARLTTLSLEMADLVRAFQQAGDDASAQAAVQIGLDLGQRLDDPRAFSVVQNLVGAKIQSNILAAMDASSPYGDTGQTVRDQLDALNQRCQNLKATWLVDGGQLQPVGELVQSLSEPDLISYLDRERTFGGWTATQWLINRQSHP